MADEQSDPNNPVVSGKLVVTGLLIVGLIGGLLLSHFMPRANPKDADEGSPYHSPLSDEELKAKLAREKAENNE